VGAGGRVGVAEAGRVAAALAGVGVNVTVAVGSGVGEGGGVGGTQATTIPDNNARHSRVRINLGIIIEF
jgi:hypothetical protein